MQALEFWKTVISDQSNFLGRIIGLLEEHGIRYCVIGGQAVNAYTEPVVTLDLDIAVMVEQIESARELLAREFEIEEFPHSLNISAKGSDLRVQMQTDPASSAYVARSAKREVLGLQLPVAAIEDVLKGKINSASDRTRRPSKQLKDLADIVRLLEVRCDLSSLVPDTIHQRISGAQAKE